MSEEKVSLTSQPQRAPQPGEAEYTPPATAVPLPSQGKIYPVGSALHGRDILELKAMTAKEEDILTSKGLIKTGRVIDALLRSCILDRNVDVDSMLVGDRNAALVAIRITGYGQGYKINVECPACTESFQHEFDLSQLPVKRLGAEPKTIGTNEFTYNLPISRKEVVFKLMTGADERELSTLLERMKKATGGQQESLVTSRLQHQILSIGGEIDKAKLANIIRNLPARDSRDLRKYMDQVSPDVDMRQNMTCQACGTESEVDVPMGTEFFWPST